MKIVGAILAFALLVGAGAVQRRWMNSSFDDEALRAAIARLERVPLEFGDWQGEPFSLDAKQLEVGEIDGYLARLYRNRTTGELFTMLVVCGRPGPISVHTPDWCYAGAGYTQLGGISEIELPGDHPGPADAFHDARFGKEQAGVSQTLRILWSWSPDGRWLSPSNSRITFAGNAYLYKLYLVQHESEQARSPDRLNTAASCRELLDAVTPALFPDHAAANLSRTERDPESAERQR